MTEEEYENSASRAEIGKLLICTKSLYNGDKSSKFRYIYISQGHTFRVVNIFEFEDGIKIHLLNSSGSEVSVVDISDILNFVSIEEQREEKLNELGI